MAPHPDVLDLPSECVLAILARLGVADVLSVGCCCRGLRSLVADDCFWSQLAEAKWGHAVRELKPLADAHAAAAAAAARAGDAAEGPPPAAGTSEGWMHYCCKRMSVRSISPSPLSLLQEQYPDPWQHIVCCVLCSRTSGSGTVRAAISRFFAALPTPSAVLAAEPAAVTALVQPLGLQETRLAAVLAVSRGFLSTDWGSPAEWHGCGRFVEDSWRVFCRGERDVRSVDDAKLKQYLAWANRAAAAAPGEAGTAAAGRRAAPAQPVGGAERRGASKRRAGAAQAEGADAPARRTRSRAAKAAEEEQRAEETGAAAAAAATPSRRSQGSRRQAHSAAQPRSAQAPAGRAPPQRDQQRAGKRRLPAGAAAATK